LNRRVFKCRLKASVEVHRRALSDREFQADGAVTENVLRTISVLVIIIIIELALICIRQVRKSKNTSG